MRSSPNRAVWVQALAEDLYSVLQQDTLLSQYLSPPRALGTR